MLTHQTEAGRLAERTAWQEGMAARTGIVKTCPPDMSGHASDTFGHDCGHSNHRFWDNNEGRLSVDTAGHRANMELSLAKIRAYSQVGMFGRGGGVRTWTGITRNRGIESGWLAFATG